MHIFYIGGTPISVQNLNKIRPDAKHWLPVWDVRDEVGSISGPENVQRGVPNFTPR